MVSVFFVATKYQFIANQYYCVISGRPSRSPHHGMAPDCTTCHPSPSCSLARRILCTFISKLLSMAILPLKVLLDRPFGDSGIMKVAIQNASSVNIFNPLIGTSVLILLGFFCSFGLRMHLFFNFNVIYFHDFPF